MIIKGIDGTKKKKEMEGIIRFRLHFKYFTKKASTVSPPVTIFPSAILSTYILRYTVHVAYIVYNMDTDQTVLFGAGGSRFIVFLV